mmetsp:Transcript_34917/g.51165  ORF Transcript_34917/g.51165 Transcript_34917/m.51165 type:complete len:276 (+) Transcript_34917:271-1098(+)
MVLLAVGTGLSYENALGRYDEDYLLLEKLSIGLGALSFVAAMLQIKVGYQVSARPRRGVIDDAVMNAYAGCYSLAVSWLAWRASPFCPTALEQLDGIVPWLASLVFLFSLVAPIMTLVENDVDDEYSSSWSKVMTKAIRQSPFSSSSKENDCIVPSSLSENELFRTQGMLAIGVLGCVFVPDCISFALGGSSGWWDRVTALHPSQRILESSTTLFALYATEASMIATRCARKGVAPYRFCVPAFAVVCALLALVPCACCLFYLGGDVSFFSFYKE